MSRPKRMLPVMGKEPTQEAKKEKPEETAGFSDGCCAPSAEPAGEPLAGTGSAAPATREANPEVPEGAILGAERTVVRVEGMDCASCALTVEKTVSRVPGVRRATVNFAAGRLDAEHDEGVALEEIEKAVEGVGWSRRGVSSAWSATASTTRRR